MRWTTTDGQRHPFSVIAKGGPSVMAEFWDGVIAPRHDVSVLEQYATIDDNSTGVEAARRIDEMFCKAMWSDSHAR